MKDSRGTKLENATICLNDGVIIEYPKKKDALPIETNIQELLEEWDGIEGVNISFSYKKER